MARGGTKHQKAREKAKQRAAELEQKAREAEQKSKEDEIEAQKLAEEANEKELLELAAKLLNELKSQQTGSSSSSGIHGQQEENNDGLTEQPLKSECRNLIITSNDSFSNNCKNKTQEEDFTSDFYPITTILGTESEKDGFVLV